MQSQELTRTPPESTKRELRQESGFGCCVCGNPIIEYQHIVPWRVEPHFRPEDMMVLCPNHHTWADQGGYSEQEQRAFKAKPKNIQRGFVHGRLSMHDKPDAVRLGGLLLLGTGDLLSVDGRPVLSVHRGESDNLEISAELRDRDDELVASIAYNEWVGDARLWDIESKPQSLKMRFKKGEIAVSVSCGTNIVSISGNLWACGQRYQITDRNFVAMPGVKNHVILGRVWGLINIDTAKLSTAIAPHPALGGVRNPTEQELAQVLGALAYREWKAVEASITVRRRHRKRRVT